MRRLETRLDGPVLLEPEVHAAYYAPELESGFRFDDPEADRALAQRSSVSSTSVCSSLSSAGQARPK